jgi:hypothetical protein
LRKESGTMKNAVASLLLLLALVTPRGASAQIPGCGNISIKTDIWQSPDYALSITGYSQSSRAMDGCLMKLRIEAWVDGTASKVAIGESWGHVGSVLYARPVPYYKDWTALAKHWHIWPTGAWDWDGYSSDTTTVRAREEPEPDTDFEPVLATGDPSCDGCVSPLLIDRDGDGFHLTSVDDGVLFDIDADGIPDQVAWTRAESGDAWLALDRNGNGVIDDGSELFGNNTPAYPNQRALKAENGFAALDLLQGPDYGPGVGDRLMDARDAMFGKLLLWTDANHNGIAEPEELRPAYAEGLLSIGLDYEEHQRRDQHGNRFRLRGRSEWLTRQGKAHMEVVWDVWLRTR